MFHPAPRIRTMDLEAAGPRFVEEAQLTPFSPQPPDQPGDGVESSGDRSEVAHLTSRSRLRQSDVDRLLVEVQPRVGANLRRGLPPS